MLRGRDVQVVAGPEPDRIGVGRALSQLPLDGLSRLEQGVRSRRRALPSSGGRLQEQEAEEHGWNIAG